MRICTPKQEKGTGGLYISCLIYFGSGTHVHAHINVTHLLTQELVKEAQAEDVLFFPSCRGTPLS